MMLIRVMPGSAVEKHALTMEDLYEVLGSKALVEELRGIGALVECAGGRRKLLFDAAEVAKVWEEFKGGKYDGLLASWSSAAGLQVVKEGAA